MTAPAEHAAAGSERSSRRSIRKAPPAGRRCSRKSPAAKWTRYAAQCRKDDRPRSAVKRLRLSGVRIANTRRMEKVDAAVRAELAAGREVELN